MARADQGIEALADLRGRIVSTGAPGSGTELIALRLLDAAGLDPSGDLERQSLGASASVDALKDGKIDAFFWSGGTPTAAVLDLASTPRVDIAFLPNAEVLPTLHAAHSPTLYFAAALPQAAYPGLGSDVPVVGVANILVVDTAMEEELAYGITRAIFDLQVDLGAIHPQARSLSPQSAVQGSPAPFHPGAVRYYRERGVWPTR